MTGLPRAADTTRPRTAYGLMVLEGIERLTTALRRGDPFSADGLDDMVQLRRRLDAFGRALDDRLHLQGMTDILEDETNE